MYAEVSIGVEESKNLIDGEQYLKKKSTSMRHCYGNCRWLGGIYSIGTVTCARPGEDKTGDS